MITLFCGAAGVLFADRYITPPLDYPTVLNWVSAPNNQFNICNGYYREHPILYTPNPLISNQINSYDVTADDVTYSATGTSILEGHVHVTEPDKELIADKVYLDRDPKTGKVVVARAYGNVQLFESGKLLVGKYARLNLVDHTAYLETTAYHMEATAYSGPVAQRDEKTKEILEFRRYGLNYWGHADTITQTQPHRYVLKNSTYTTCPPSNTSCAWHLTAKTVNLNRDEGVGRAWNSVLWVKQLPVFYFPYVSFPLNHDRKTGFLVPVYSHTNSYGLGFAFPFYWNMAPNYDSTITPSYMTKRGFMISDMFRYINHGGYGKGTIQLLPNDRAFASFKKEQAEEVNNYSSPQLLNQLENDSTTRYSISWESKQQLTDHIKGSVNYQGISDDYFNKDLSKNLVNNSGNQLYQEADLQYLGTAWNFGGGVYNYQTLHLINQQTVQNEYANLPNLSAGYTYPASSNNNLTASASANDIQFYELPIPDQHNKPEQGNRFVVNSSVGYPMLAPYGSFTPQLSLQAVRYNAYQLPKGVSRTAASVIPTLTLNGILYFNRYFSLWDDLYRQTLEPQLFYAYIPYVNQSDQPIFDRGSSQPFNYNNLFSTNRFGMVDRIGDMNQLTGAVTTRFINAETGDTLGLISAGEIMYLQKEKANTCQGSNCTHEKPNPNLLSPIAVHAEYYFMNKLTALTDLTWQQDGRTLNDGLNIKYRDAGKVLNVNYAISSSGLFTNPAALKQPKATLNSLDLSGEFLIMRHVNVLGRWNYSWSGNATKDHGTAYLAGLEYDACCWAIRFVATRTYQGILPNSLTQYENQYYIQADLRGLGSFGNQDPSGALYDNIAGFQNSFDQAIGDSSTA